MSKFQAPGGTVEGGLIATLMSIRLFGSTVVLQSQSMD